MIYFDKLNKKQTDILNKLQKKAIRLVFNAKMRCHTGKLLKLAEITPIDQIYKCETLKFVYKYRNELTKYEQPQALSEIFNYETKNKKSRQSYNKTNKTLLKQYTKNNIKNCTVKKCFQCTIDKNVKYEKYMSK